MKYLPALLSATLLAIIAPLHLSAQEAPSAFGLTPGQPETLLPEGQTGLPLIPEAMPPLERPPQTQTGKPKKEKQSATAAAEDEIRDRIKLREAKNKVQNDPEMQALWDSRFKARTDFEYRAILTDYYTKFWARVARLEKSIKPNEIETFKKRSLSNFAQTRIAPTVPPASAR